MSLPTRCSPAGDRWTVGQHLPAALEVRRIGGFPEGGTRVRGPEARGKEDLIRTDQRSLTGLLAVERRAPRDVIGYCGLIDR